MSDRSTERQANTAGGDSLQGQAVVITGASSGFGRGAALEFAARGARVMLAARRGELLDEVAQDIEAQGGIAIAQPTDVSDAQAVEELARQAVQAFGQIDVWVNDAGAGAIGPFERIPLADHVQVIATDLLGTLYGTYYAYLQFRKQGYGTLINVSSELGKTSVPYYTTYTAAKHGVVGLSTSLRQEIQQDPAVRDRIHVCVVMPTAHDTPFFDHAANYTGHELVAPKPLHHPDEVIETIVQLATHPKDEKIVGSDGYLKFLEAHLMPDTAEKLSAKMMHKMQMEDPPAGPDTPGAVRRPIPEGAGVSGNRL